jgi:phosphate transport system protein
MRNKFDIMLETLNSDLVAMGVLCENAIEHAVNGLLNNDAEYARKALALEKETDRKERDIETLCLRLILQQQPVARDLRLISAALKMITDMERIGDQAAEIAELISVTNILPGNIINEHISNMSKAVMTMVTESIEAFVKHDIELAEYVVNYDDVVDDLFVHIKKDIVNLITEDAVNGEAAIDELMIAKYLERIGDHAVNVAEWVIFSITGLHKEETAVNSLPENLRTDGTWSV